MSDYLPPEVFMDIMTRLPVDAILRCTSVSKTWYTLITSPAFISIHLNKSIAKNSNTPKLLLRHCVKEDSVLEKYSFHSDNESFDALCTEFTIPLKTSMTYYRIIGILNGLLCLCDDNICGTHNMFLWNPHIRKVFKVPTPPAYTYSYSNTDYEHSFGFGFVPSTSEYKIVRVLYLQVEVFELSTGCWRRISDDNYSLAIHWRNPQAFLDGVVHWIGYHRSTRAQTIVSFHMENEFFSAMGMPVGVEASAWTCRVAVYGDSLCLVDSVQSGGDCCYIWVMKEYGKPQSWTKEFTIDLEHGRFRSPFGFRANGNFLMATEGGDLVSYDPSTRQTKSLGINGYLNYEAEACTFVADAYVESLILLRRENFSGQVAIVPEEEDDFGTQICNDIEEITIKSEGSS